MHGLFRSVLFNFQMPRHLEIFPNIFIIDLWFHFVAREHMAVLFRFFEINWDFLCDSASGYLSEYSMGTWNPFCFLFQPEEDRQVGLRAKRPLYSGWDVGVMQVDVFTVTLVVYFLWKGVRRSLLCMSDYKTVMK